jgi:ferredoxin/flavodoxin---NADP+ reductase
MFRIVSNQMIVPNLHLMTVEAPDVAAEVQPGQFVIVRANEGGERIPLSVSDWDRDKGTITIVFMNVGRTTSQLADLPSDVSIPTVVGPLGLPTEIDNFGTVLCVGGCYGIGSIYPIARALKEKGNKVVVMVEARSSYLLYWEDRLKSVSDRFFAVTRDGTRGQRGHVGRLPEIVNTLEQKVDRVIANGCTFMLKRVSDTTRPLEIKTMVSLNPIMIDGTGMCGVCRVTVGSATRFACVHGPDFDGHQIDWKELLQRRKTYLREEIIPLRSSRCEEHAVQRQR